VKHWLLAAALICFGSSAFAAPPPTYINTVRITPGASPARVLAFQNTSSTIDVVVRKIEVVSASTQTVTSGLEQFWVYASTQLTHSASAGRFDSYSAGFTTQPSYVTVSTAPLLVLFENDTSTLTAGQQAGLSGTALPLIKPLTVNLDEGAAANFYDSWVSEDPSNNSPLILPAGANRALVFEKRQKDGTDYSAGLVQIRIYYTVR
jgi:hypothetical protein